MIIWKWPLNSASSGRYPWLPPRQLFAGAIALQRFRWWRSDCWPWSSSRFISPLARHWWLCWRVALCASLLAYMGCWLAADEMVAGALVRSHGRVDVYFPQLVKASRLFPLDSEVRRSPAEVALALAGGLPPAVVLKFVNLALEGDPWAPDLLHDRDLLMAAGQAAELKGR